MARFETIKEKLPPKEQIYFVLSALFAVGLIVLMVQRRVPSYEELEQRLIESERGGLETYKVREILARSQQELSKKLESQNDQRVREKLRDWSSYHIQEDGRLLFIRKGEESFRVDPPNLYFPQIPSLLDFRVALGERPQVDLQTRFRKRKERRVYLAPPRDESEDWEDLEKE